MSEIYHVLSRGVDKRKIFMDDEDRYRFIHDLFEFNNQEPANSTYYQFNVIARRKFEPNEKKPRKLLVDLHVFCLMDNHYHLLISPRHEGSISLFMKKVNMGYAKYFNNKYERVGTLFEGRFKSVPVKNDAHFIHLPYYIHFNPLDFKFKEWRDRKLTNYRKAIEFLDSYRWSSHRDYSGEKNFPSVTQRELLSEFFDGPDGYKKSIKSWLQNLDLDSIKKLVLE
ncbi:MAG: transposase [bacterium]|nr:transposase [bacterium]